ncbi:hypothetical protein D7X55_19570 [Corallococcus sp. AB049A]|uniref:Uncharacterized protein n=1 Tax=Corallococcus interemptor TaxID=2316720 RepID=A0A3A8PST4_9BACT|nr:MULTISPECIES: hypothetical protein [Corallococcus]RKH41839.1 hypothetical protein D7Y23_32270 [Corallococcus sp. AB050B]RKH59517.1 hypothetical protein D7X96_35245 [Corallococcus interemptor]RKI63670.1 hypothetical protein D7X55_19570 [Corallococcus sp. AB049A]
MDAFDIVIISVIAALGVGRFLVMRDQRRAPPADAGPHKPTPQRIAGRVLLGYAYAMALFLIVRFLISRM